MRVDRVAVEATSDVVVDAAPGHFAAAEGDVRNRVLRLIGRQRVGGGEQQVEVGRGREFGSGSEAPVRSIRAPQQRARGPNDGFRSGRLPSAGR